jgi:hypothetical protein
MGNDIARAKLFSQQGTLSATDDGASYRSEDPANNLP